MSEHIYGGVAIEHGAAKGEARLERREEIVRCRDCECYHQFTTYAGTPLGYGECMKHRRQTYGSCFCAWGERRDA